MKLALLYTLVILLLVFNLVFGQYGILKYQQMQRLEKDYREAIDRLNDRIQYTERELELLKTDNAYLDFVIRRELGLQMKDEDQYIVSDDAKFQGR
jgi:cell division protein FtsB